ncbi:hypothetical protein G9A89_008104 [Geosiphon pyriformis]|nr:hypothetical protein G9A89_008104 [Geosiphon pyriformis]
MVMLPQCFDPQFEQFFSILPQDIGIGTIFDPIAQAGSQPISLEELMDPSLKFHNLFSIMSPVETRNELERNYLAEFHEANFLNDIKTLTTINNHQSPDFPEVNFLHDIGNVTRPNNYQSPDLHDVCFPQNFRNVTDLNFCQPPALNKPTLGQDFSTEKNKKIKNFFEVSLPQKDGVNYHNDPEFPDVTLQDLMEPSFEVEYLLSNLSREQLVAIEKNLNKAKNKKLNLMKVPKDGRVEKKVRKPKPTPLICLPTPPRTILYQNTGLATPQESTDSFLANFSPKSDTNFYTKSETQFFGLETPLTTPTSIMNNFWMDPINPKLEGSAAQYTSPQESKPHKYNFISSEYNNIPLPKPGLNSSDKLKAEAASAHNKNTTIPNQESSDILDGLKFNTDQQQRFPIQSSHQKLGYENFNFASSEPKEITIPKLELDPFSKSKIQEIFGSMENMPVTNELAMEYPGVESMIFSYSHHHVLKTYRIRTDIQNVDINLIDEQFKRDNCIYPRAFCLPEAYNGNRWIYETECNSLGWILAFLNPEELGGKRGLIQRAVDSFRNRQPGSKSRRVARQEKVMKGTLRKRKASYPGDEDARPLKRKLAISHKPRTILLEDIVSGTKIRIKINVEEVDLNQVDSTFKRNNCVYPRAAFCTREQYTGRRYEEEVGCNELAWKLAWLNPRSLANKKRLLQLAIDLYRTRFTSNFKPRSARLPEDFDIQATTFITNPCNNIEMETHAAPAEMLTTNETLLDNLPQRKIYFENLPPEGYDNFLLGCNQPNEMPLWHYTDLADEQQY